MSTYVYVSLCVFTYITSSKPVKINSQPPHNCNLHTHTHTYAYKHKIANIQNKNIVKRNKNIYATRLL